MKRHLSGALAFLFTVCCLSAIAHAGDGNDALRLLPENTAMVASFNIERTSRSATGKRFLDTVLDVRSLSGVPGDFLRRAGVDIERDIETMIVAMADDYDKSEDLVLLFEGRFNQKKIVAVARKESSTFATRKYRGVTYYELDDDSAFGFIGRYAVVTPIRTMPKIIDVHARKAPSSSKNRALMGLVKGGDTKKDMWGVFEIPRELRSEISKETGGHSVKGLMISIDLKNGMSMKARMNVLRSEGAAAIAALMRKTATDAARDPQIAAVGVADAMRRMTVKQKGARLDITFTLTKTELSDFIKAVQELTERSREVGEGPVRPPQ